MKLNLYRGITYIFSAKFGTILLHILISPLLIRYLGTGYGNYAFVISVLAIATLFLNGGVFDGIRKFIIERSDEKWKSEVFSFYIRAACAMAAVIILSLVAAIELGFVQQFLGEEFRIYFYLLSLMILTRVFFIISRGTLMGLGSEHLSELLYTLHRLFFGVLGVGMAVLGFGVTGVLIGDIAATGLVMVAGLVLVARRVRIRGVFTSSSVSFPTRKLLGYSSTSFVLTVLFNSLYHVDILLLRPLTGAQLTAQYKAALLVAEFLWVVPTAIQTSLVHISSAMWADEQYDRIDHLASRMMRYTLLLHVLLAIGLAVLAEPFVSLYFGSEFLPAVAPLLVLIPGALGFALTRPLIGIGKGKRNLRVLVYATTGAALVNIVLNVALIPLYGMMGAAIATTIGYGSMLGFHLWSSHRMGFTPLGDLRLRSITTTAGITVPVIYSLSIVIEDDVLSLFVIPTVGFLVYAGAAFWTGALSRHEIDHILERLPVPTPVLFRNLFKT